MKALKTDIFPIQCRDTGLALAFLALLVWTVSGAVYAIYAAMAILLFAMAWPSTMIWPARLWFGFSHLLGSVMSRLLLGIIYMLVLFPVGVMRRLLGKDPLSLRRWKIASPSLFIVRDITYKKEDINHPY